MDGRSSGNRLLSRIPILAIFHLIFFSLSFPNFFSLLHFHNCHMRFEITVRSGKEKSHSVLYFLYPSVTQKEWLMKMYEKNWQHSQDPACKKQRTKNKMDNFWNTVGIKHLICILQSCSTCYLNGRNLENIKLKLEENT